MATKRTRATHSKRSTGCGTCKIRHKRCDEEKPICQNCQRTNRICDGYIDPDTGLRYGGQLRSSDTSNTQIVQNPLEIRFSTEREAQGFRFFEAITAFQLAHALGSKDWPVLILQSAHQSSTLLHSLIAIGFLCKKLEVNDLVTSTAPDAVALHQFALEQYSEALVGLRLALETPGDDAPQGEFVLLTSVLFVIFEFLQGNAEGALVHLKSTVQIADSVEDGPRSGRIKVLLAMVDMTMTIWLGLDRAQSGTGVSFQLLATSLMTPSKPGAQGCMDELMSFNNDVLSVRHADALYSGDSPGSDPSDVGVYLETEKQMLRTRLNSWYHSFIRTPFEDRYAATTLHVSYLMTQLLLGEDSSANYAGGNFEELGSSSKYEEIIDIVEEALKDIHLPRRYSMSRDDTLENITLLPIFSFRFSYAQPLFFVARAAPDTTVRLRAIDLLLRNPWREGAWDSGALGLIAQRLPVNSNLPYDLQSMDLRTI
ncbi:hypothetical protein H072_10747 [Dactylellina haptotyla CBS 200.50]|uniref:Zn(2)-C6 fungal-type domain-containing protein n=1 Tax=Dactylellina haptotyla (strain CBS 200.50) TaxID=1284197 RepID=S8B9R4_DACHA|nr:hypothetical protein H072_10747 [Dactylellina haptotyla CBS 200.50]